MEAQNVAWSYPDDTLAPPSTGTLAPLAPLEASAGQEAFRERAVLQERLRDEHRKEEQQIRKEKQNLIRQVGFITEEWIVSIFSESHLPMNNRTMLEKMTIWFFK